MDRAVSEGKQRADMELADFATRVSSGPSVLAQPGSFDRQLAPVNIHSLTAMASLTVQSEVSAS